VVRKAAETLLRCLRGNSYDRMEWAGAFGDMGTLVPFVLAYVTVLRMDPVGLLFAFALAKIVAGLHYRTPIPIQPMKAIGIASTMQLGSVTPAMVWGAGMFTGLTWLVLGLTNTVDRVAALARPPVVRGIVLGLALSFMREGLSTMRADPVVAVAAFVAALLLLPNRRMPAMFALLILGLAVGLARHPSLAAQATQGIGLRLPHPGIPRLHLSDFVSGTLLLGLPQLPLTLGNAIIAIVAENNELFPHRPITVRKVAVSTGIINLAAPFFGGVPMCHGAGGMAGHVRFGARTGGALVILGGVLLAATLFFGEGVTAAFRLFPAGVLGVILFFSGLELAATSKIWELPPGEFPLAIITTAVAMWNMGAAFLVGVILWQASKRRWVHLAPAC